MKSFRPLFAATALVVFPALAALAAEKKSASIPLLDFTSSRVSGEGVVVKKVGYITVDKPGKVSGFDKRNVETWQIKGDYQTAVVAILVLKLNSAN